MLIDKGIFESQMETLVLWKTLENKCNKNGDIKTLFEVKEVGKYAITKLDTIMLNMKEFTLHDHVHVFNMLKIIEIILSPDVIEQLSIPDLMLIFFTVFLHDIGMCMEEETARVLKGEQCEKIKKIKIKEEYDRYVKFCKTEWMFENGKIKSSQELTELEREYMLSQYIRATHAERVREYIAGDLKGYFDYANIDLSNIVADICVSHSKDYKYLLDMEAIKVCGNGVYTCIPFIAILLRLSDIIDFDSTRAPKELFEHLSIRDKISFQEWKKHQSVEAWTITNDLIIIAAECEHPTIEFIIRKFCDLIDNELKNATHVMINLHEQNLEDKLILYKNIKFPIQVDRSKIRAKKDLFNKPIYRYHETTFTLSKNHIIELLMGTKLYNSPDVALRELIQNSIDACVLRKKLCEMYNISYEPSILIEYYREQGQDYLEVIDNGMGMDQNIIDKYYTNIGISYYKSREFLNLIVENKIDFKPISKFGIGILACFMVCDEMRVETRRIIGRYKYEDPISVEINGYDSIFLIKDGSKEEPGTETILKLRENHPWGEMDKKSFVDCIRSIVKNPQFPIRILYQQEDVYIYKQEENLYKYDLERIKKRWIMAPNIKRIDFEINSLEYGFKGIASVAYIERKDMPVSKLSMNNHYVVVDGKPYELFSTYTYDEYGIFKSSDTIEFSDDNEIVVVSNASTTMPSYAEVSLRGITIPRNLFVDFSDYEQKAVINFPLPTILVLDVYDKTELNLNSARTNVVYDDAWKEFEQKLILVLCENLRSHLTKKQWSELQGIIINKMKDDYLKRIVDKMELL